MALDICMLYDRIEIVELVMLPTWQVKSHSTEKWECEAVNTRGKSRWRVTGSTRMCVIPAGHVGHTHL